MARRIHALFALALVTFALSAAACADSTAPETNSNVRANSGCDWQSGSTCK